MKVRLMFPDRDFDLKQDGPPAEPMLLQDLELTTLFQAMSRGDPIIEEVVHKAVLASCLEPDTIRYRQRILQDCLLNEPIIRQVFGLVVDTIESERKNHFGSVFNSPALTVHRGVAVLGMLADKLHRLKLMADEHAGRFSSDGFSRLFGMLRQELDDDYIRELRQRLKELGFGQGLLMSARLTDGNKGTDYVLRRENAEQPGWVGRLLGSGPPSHSFTLPDRDESGARALAELRDRGLNLVVNAVGRSAAHVLGFFRMLRTELAFYVGCLNLHGRLVSDGRRLCFPHVAPAGQRRLFASGLYDACLALRSKDGIVGNDLQAEEKSLVIITGANQGGKSTFLRSIGLAQLMMQSGLFVAAEAFEASVCTGMFTHYRREEDATMRSGKFDEELRRMDDIACHLARDALVLFNESFAATNEREGSEVARQVATALVDSGVKVVFVTHQYEFAHGLATRGRTDTLFLRAERRDDHVRTFRLEEGEPLRTSYGPDLYETVFAGPAAVAPSGVRPH